MSNVKEEKMVKFGIVTRIKALLGLGDEGKLLAFFTKFKKQAEADIKKLEANLSKNELDFKLNVQDLDDKIEDAKQAVEDALMNVDLESIQTNEAQKQYLEQYLFNIKSKERTLSNLEADKKEIEDQYEDLIKETKKNIKTIKDRIVKILG